MILPSLIREKKLSYYSMMLVMFLLPISREIFIIALWPLLLFTLAEIIINKNVRILRKDWQFIPYMLLAGLLVLYALSLLWTVDVKQGLNIIGRSLLLLIIPAIFYFNQWQETRKDSLPGLMRSFVYGVMFSTLLLWGAALISSITFREGTLVFSSKKGLIDSIFFYQNFSFLIHPTYYSMMVLMAITFCMDQISFKTLSSSHTRWKVIQSIYLFAIIIMVSSRAMILAGILLIILMLYYSLKRFKSFKISFIILLLLGSVFLLHPRMRFITSQVLKESNTFSFEQLLNINERGKTWHASLKLIRPNILLGVGPGDVKEELTKEYSRLGYSPEFQNYLNCHNQFLETWLSIGLIGLILLLSILFLPYIFFNLSNRFLYTGFIIIICCGFMFESLLNRVWGIAFFSIFYLMLVTPSPSQQPWSE